MNNLMIFENKPVEVFKFNGQVLFNPYHCGECLELSPEGVRKAITRMNEKQVIKLTNSKVTDSNFRKFHNTGENFLTESGVYKLIFKSHKEEAEKFQDWVTDEILPSIRKTGSYNPIGILESLQTELQSTRQKLEALEKVVYKKERQKLSSKKHQLRIGSTFEQRMSSVDDDEILDIIRYVMSTGILRDIEKGFVIDKDMVFNEAKKRNITKYILNKKLVVLDIVVLNNNNHPYRQVKIDGETKWCYVVKKERLGV